MTLFTVGHSNIAPGELERLLDHCNIDVLMDVRSHPGSSHCPHFNRVELMQSCKDHGIEYRWEPRLGGWLPKHEWCIPEMDAAGINIRPYMGKDFPKQAIAPKLKPVPGKPSWTNLGLLTYSWFMTLDEFMQGVDDLVRFARGRRVAIMCAELLWWKCHRSMIADYLVWRGVNITHITPKETRHKRVIDNRLDRYDPYIIKRWEDHRDRRHV